MCFTLVSGCKGLHVLFVQVRVQASEEGLTILVMVFKSLKYYLNFI